MLPGMHCGRRETDSNFLCVASNLTPFLGPFTPKWTRYRVVVLTQHII